MPEQTAYRTLAATGMDRFTEQRSEFIGYASPCQTEAQALAFLEKIRSKHADAKHCVYAYILRENHISRFSDDREPSGTAGLPTLNILRRGEITDACVAVVRYFGGILLGTGGLTRAYTKGAQLAVEAAGIVLRRLHRTFTVNLGYSDYQKVLSLFVRFSVQTVQTSYTDRVKIYGAVPVEMQAAFAVALADITCGAANLSLGEERFETVWAKAE